MSACPFREDLLFTVYNTTQEFKTTLWKLRAPSISSLQSTDADDLDHEVDKQQQQQEQQDYEVKKQSMGSQDASMVPLVTLDNGQSLVHRYS